MSDSADCSGQSGRTLRVTVVHAPPESGSGIRLELTLPAPATVGDALELARVTSPALRAVLDDATPAGIYGERVARSHGLADHDRIELYLPLRIDPVEARRLSAESARKRAANRRSR